jgi:hypothetical protein
LTTLYLAGVKTLTRKFKLWFGLKKNFESFESNQIQQPKFDNPFLLFILSFGPFGLDGSTGHHNAGPHWPLAPFLFMFSLHESVLHRNCYRHSPQPNVGPTASHPTWPKLAHRTRLQPPAVATTATFPATHRHAVCHSGLLLTELKSCWASSSSSPDPGATPFVPLLEIIE